MSNKGQCWDYAVQGRFFSTLKSEPGPRQARGTRAHTRSEVFEWMGFGGGQRPHASPCSCSSKATGERASLAELRLLYTRATPSAPWRI